jgi:transposase-like protein
MGRKKGSSPKMEYLKAHKLEISEKLKAGVSIKHIYQEYGIAHETFRQFRKKYLSDTDKA